MTNNRITRCHGRLEPWYNNGNLQNHPTKIQLKDEGAEYTYVFKNWIPKIPFIDKNTKITSFGSCFAHHIYNYLLNKKYNINSTQSKNIPYVILHTDAIVNTYSMLQQFEWALENRIFGEDLWYSAKGFLVDHLNENVRESTKKLFNESKVFILTLGLSEIWMNTNTKDVFWRGVPARKFDKELHEFKIVEAEENEENIIKIINIIRKNVPDAIIIFTLSPIPLRATFRTTPSITSDCVSKASLRVALDKVFRKYYNDNGLYYFPSYELIKYLEKDPYQEDNTHINDNVVTKMMKYFDEYFLIKE